MQSVLAKIKIVVLVILLAKLIHGHPQNRRASDQSVHGMQTIRQTMLLPGDIAINQSQPKRKIIAFPTDKNSDTSPDSDHLSNHKVKTNRKIQKVKTTGAVLKFPENKVHKQLKNDGITDIYTELDRQIPHKLQTDRHTVKVTNRENEDKANIADTIDRQEFTTLTSTRDTSKQNSLDECMKSGQLFCEDSSVKFSNEFIESILAKPENKMFLKFFRDPNEEEDASIQNRFGARPQGVVVPLCETFQSRTHPTYARDYNGEYSPIINNDHFQQPVYIEQCLSKFANHINPIWLPEHHKLVCSQGYQTYQLLAPSHSDSSTFDMKTFDVPSHCLIELIKMN